MRTLEKRRTPVGSGLPNNEVLAGHKAVQPGPCSGISASMGNRKLRVHAQHCVSMFRRLETKAKSATMVSYSAVQTAPRVGNMAPMSSKGRARTLARFRAG
ncbi:uncharacterized protein ColSpa_09612 [Colletotrichum spaethianum]|uniref:Uncharacterized protein n=1 Tax=Colletotrichum spaethianum TaxID=700344 RepID=A0AA37PBW7_9PEZI|nr:uncharacterized protein ColSpa_09612 [Colletotrichum spaethianum]GKT49431.1 hypothetical protein ColSpa_09612 [Colletotrichum spaethianum]